MSSSEFEVQLKEDLLSCISCLVSRDCVPSISKRISYSCGFLEEKYPYLSDFLENILLNQRSKISF